jgi:hypothetical protein
MTDYSPLISMNVYLFMPKMRDDVEKMWVYDFDIKTLHDITHM